MRPGAGERDIEVIAPARGGKAAFARRTGAAVFRHPVAEARGRAQEAPGRRALRMLLVLPDAVDQKAHAELPLFTTYIRCRTPAHAGHLVSRFRSSQDIAEPSDANFGIKGTLATL